MGTYSTSSWLSSYLSLCHKYFWKESTSRLPRTLSGRCSVPKNVSSLYTQGRYTWHIYVAQRPQPQIENIPITYCIMYVVPNSNSPEQTQFFLNSSWPGNYLAAGNRIRQAVDPWRKEVLAICLGQIAGTGEGMPKSLLVFESLYLKDLRRRERAMSSERRYDDLTNQK